MIIKLILEPLRDKHLINNTIRIILKKEDDTELAKGYMPIEYVFNMLKDVPVYIEDDL